MFARVRFQDFVLNDDAFERQQPVDAGGPEAGLGGDLLGDLDGGGQRRRVDAQPARARCRLEGERGLNIAALEPAARQHPGRRLDGIESRRQAQA